MVTQSFPLFDLLDRASPSHAPAKARLDRRPAIDLHDQVILISGTDGDGIGRALLFVAVQWGARVLGCGLNGAKGQEAVDLANTIRPGMAHFVEADLTHKDDICRVVQTALRVFDGIDILVNNAGRAFAHDDFLTVDVADLIAAVTANAGVALQMTQAVLPAMLQQGRGSVVNVSSVNAISGQYQQPCYAAAKAMLGPWVRDLTALYFRRGVTFNNVIAGSIPNGSAKNELRRVKHPGFEEGLASLTARKKLVTPVEIAEVILGITANPFRAMSGQEIVIDGGLLAAGGPLAEPGTDFRQIASDIYESGLFRRL